MTNSPRHDAKKDRKSRSRHSEEGKAASSSKPKPRRAKSPLPKQDVRIVAVGASAGGLEALEHFFRALRSDTGFAFVVVQHLSPDFPSMMDELLGRHTRMPILQISHGASVEPNTIYLRPARQTLVVEGARLLLEEEDASKHLSLPIDAFLNSLAIEFRDRAIGVILSGTGSDGSLGSASIRDVGGTVLVQEPASARFDSMPRSIIDRNLANAVASPIGLAELINRLASGQSLPGEDEELEDGRPLDPETIIVRLLQRRCGTDFGYYKTSTVGRRIRRRAEMARIDNLADYANLLRNTPEELDLLTKDLLIGVTQFFRDPEAFHALQEDVIQPLGPSLGGHEQFRVWIPGCATGEEAYSIAIVLSEAARKAGVELDAKIFATDIFPPALEIAGRGIYEAESLAHLPSPLVSRYFEASGSRLQVRPSLRRLVVFSNHNLLKDPPFTRMHLISCRNLLIYFNEVAQRKVLTFFHLALNVNGTLFLGSSETLSELAEEFSTVDSKWRIYRKLRDVRLRDSLRMLPPSALRANRPEAGPDGIGSARARSLHGAGGLVSRRGISKAYDTLLERHAPPSVLVDRQGQIMHVFGDAKKFLSFGSGVFSSLLIDAVNEQLRHPIIAGLERMRGNGISAFTRHVSIEGGDGGTQTVKITIEQLDRGDWVDEGYSLVSFEVQIREATIVEAKRFVAAPESESDLEFYGERIKELEHELKVTEESLQSTIQEMETTNEELQATNEELMASNEELQSTNEELHSVNEELYTVSAEHQRKLDELIEVTADLDHVLTSTEIGVIYLDQQLRLRRFTPAAASIFRLLERDIGQPFEHIRPRFDNFDLIETLRAMDTDQGISEHEVEVDNHTYLLRILPYEVSDKLAGYGLTFIDVTQRKHSEREVKVSERRLHSIVRTALDAIVVIDENGIIQSINPATEQILGYSAKEVVGKNVSCLMPAEHATAHDSYLDNYKRTGIRKIIGVGREVQGRRKDGSFVSLDLAIAEWRDANGVRFFTGIMRDMTERKVAQRKLSDALRTITLAAEAGEMGTWHLDVESGTLNLSDELLRLLGQRRETWSSTPQALASLIHPDDVDNWFAARERALSQGDRFDLEFRIIRPGGGIRWIHSRGDIRRTQDGGAVEAYGVMADITERKRSEQRQALLIAELDHRVKNTLARMTSIVESSRHGAQSIDDLTAAIVGRLNALARSHARLSRSRWAGAGLKSLIEEELAPYRRDHNVAVDGPDIVLNSEAAQAMCMIFHELCTNAAKYGAFSNSHGHVAIDWDTVRKGDAMWLELHWRETGHAVRKPKQMGFGTRLIQNLLRHGLGGKANLKFGETGVNCQIEIPVARLS
ncbi:MAG: PAS domain S-box protein [Hyphomicrobiaceae bacterium]|nr:PAS domain S-box protein [Hyphomicrobiaceae bacterium]